MKTKSSGGCPRPLGAVAFAILAGAGLAGCGGGGGDAGFPLPLASAPVNPVVPDRSSSTPPAPTPAASRAPVEGSEPLPLLSAPQAGSTAATGNDSEGLYESLFGFAYVGADGSIARKFNVGTLWGSIAVTGLNWVFKPNTGFFFVDLSLVTGSGTFSPKVSMDGSYARDGRESSAFGPLAYSAANALAVSQDSVAGRWANVDTTFGISVAVDVDATGAYTGTTAGAQIGNCKLSGFIALAQPGTVKNMYGFTMNAVDAGTEAASACKLEKSYEYNGPAALVFSPAGDYASNGYFRNISVLAKTLNGATLAVALRKQK